MEGDREAVGGEPRFAIRYPTAVDPKPAVWSKSALPVEGRRLKIDTPLASAPKSQKLFGTEAPGAPNCAAPATVDGGDGPPIASSSVGVWPGSRWFNGGCVCPAIASGCSS